MHIEKRKTRLRASLVIILFILTLTALRIGWLCYFNAPNHADHANAYKGVMDLRTADFDAKKTIALNGEWLFYPHELISPNKPSKAEISQFIQVPGKWKANVFSEENQARGYGTYRLKILLPKNNKHYYGLQLNKFNTFANVFVNGQLLNDYNFAEKTLKDKVKTQGPMNIYFPSEHSEIELVIQVTNVNNLNSGGLVDSVHFGLQSAINKRAVFSKSLQLLVGMIFLLHVIYALAIFFLGRGRYEKELVYFSLLLFLSGFAVLIDDDAPLHLPLTDGLFTGLLLLVLLSTAVITLQFVHELFKTKSRLTTLLFLFYIPFPFLLLNASMLFSKPMQSVLLIYEIMLVSQLVRQTVLALRKGKDGSIFIVLYMICFTSNIIWGTAIQLNFIDIPYYPFDYIISIMVIALMLFRRHMQVVRLSDEQTQKLKKADKQKDIFLANTSHELRNPLHGIMNIAHSVLDDKADQLTEESRQSLRLLLDIGRRMSFTLNDLLDLNRLEEKHIHIRPVPLNIHSTAAAVIEMIRFMKTDHTVKMKLMIPPDFPAILADENRLVQILFNLLHNAVKYTKEGSIVINAATSNDTATITVEDTGIGMSKEETARLFLRYEQADNSTSEGIGLGLNISKQLIELHKGHIWVESSLGQGTMFSFTLPLANENPSDLPAKELLVRNPLIGNMSNHSYEESAVAVEVADPLHAANILIVDDDPVNLKVLSNILKSEYNVSTASDGYKALKKMTERECDLIISDVMIPQMSGYELTRQIREHYSISELPILLLTARNQTADIYTGFLAGANDYVAKPTDAIELKARVKALITLKTSIKEQFRLEAAWLQAQIKPHFLFNTLNTIASLGELDTDRMVNLLHEFGNYLRRSFNTSNTKSLIPIEDELDLVNSYLFIESERFGDRLKIAWELGDITNIQVPPLSIQTLVENAANHGVLKLPAGGTITIKVVNEETSDTIMVQDNGAGMTYNKMQEILERKNNHENGIGIVNTDRRLRQLFGKGLHIISSSGEGTSISFSVPHSQRKTD